MNPFDSLLARMNRFQEKRETCLHGLNSEIAVPGGGGYFLIKS